MNLHYPTIDEPATPAYILAVIQDEHRQQCQYDWEADPDAVLTPETTVAEWRDACDLVGWRKLGQACNKTLGIGVSENEWREALEPADRKRLSDVCQLIAKYARRPKVRPAVLFGRTCTRAGTFLTIRSLLRQAGAPVKDIRPSTLLAPYARRYTGVFLDSISRLAPGALPPVRTRASMIRKLANWGAIGGLLCWIAGVFSAWDLLSSVGGMLFVSSFCLNWCPARYLFASVEFGELRTFRDLAIVISEGTERVHGV
ncbi:hypothetical protein AGMMS49545_13280 [Betaproteobacteria bacterium]|nr:hypothetical protein AGMMS49545_13280 [Betaproteobacteria bacterium]GHU39822.1 hypothetical protein AGMMS50289_00240 [Betaproteobacteria bacterium]